MHIVERSVAHSKGILHRTAHVWIIKEVDGRWQVLLQKRSAEKDSYPGMYDTSSAGHIPAGMEPLASARRELAEELGICASEDELQFIGTFRTQYEEVFHGKPFRDNEVISIYVYKEPVDPEKLVLQESEVDEVRWFDVEEEASPSCGSRSLSAAGSRGVFISSLIDGSRYNYEMDF